MKDPKVEGLNKLDLILGNKKKFRRFILLLFVVGVFGVAGVAAWKGCQIETKTIKINEKSEVKK